MMNLLEERSKVSAQAELSAAFHAFFALVAPLREVIVCGTPGDIRTRNDRLLHRSRECERRTP